MSKASRVLAVLAAVAALIVAGCGSNKEEARWNAALAADSLQVYQEFVELYPKSQHAAQARDRIDGIRHPFKDLGFPDMELEARDLGMTCWGDSVAVKSYRFTADTFMSWDDLASHFGLDIDTARMWYPKGAEKSLAGISINQDGERVIFGAICIGTGVKAVLVDGPIVQKSGGFLFQKGALLAVEAP